MPAEDYFKPFDQIQFTKEKEVPPNPGDKMTRRFYLPIHLENYDWLSYLDQWVLVGEKLNQTRKWEIGNEFDLGIYCRLSSDDASPESISRVVMKGGLTVEEAVYLAMGEVW